MKKLLSIILAAAMALTLLAGCSSDPGGASQAPSNPPADNSQPAENPPEAAGSIKLAALSSGYITNYPDMWKEVCEAFTAETGVEVELTLEKNLEEVIVHELMHLKMYPLDQVTEALITSHFEEGTPGRSFAYRQFFTSLEITVEELAKCFLLEFGEDKELSFGRCAREKSFNELYDGLNNLE